MAEKLIDQSKLASSIADKIGYEFRAAFLVKPLPPVKIKKEFSKPIPESDKPKKDKNGVEAVDYDKVETEVKEVDSDWKRAVVLKMPTDYKLQRDDKGHAPLEIKVGDILVYEARRGQKFDLLKDSELVYYYDILAVEETEKK